MHLDLIIHILTFLSDYERMSARLTNSEFNLAFYQIPFDTYEEVIARTFPQARLHVTNKSQLSSVEASQVSTITLSECDLFDFTSFSCLTHLYVSGCGLTQLYLPSNVIHVDASRNSLTEIYIPNSCKYLYISLNRLSHLSTNARYIDCSANCLSTLKADNAEYVDCSYNRLPFATSSLSSSGEKECANLSSVVELIGTHNLFKTLESNARYISCASNPLERLVTPYAQYIDNRYNDSTYITCPNNCIVDR